jgi:glycosyltransferase involved in cell wall biosynthesis
LYVRRVTSPWISVTVPAYNEAQGIVTTIATLKGRLEALGRPYEIIVVDNASEDDTVKALEPLLDGRRVRLLRNEVNRGKGFSVRRGMLDARGKLRLMCDADCGPSLDDLPKMLDAIEHADVVVGSRSARGAQVDRQQPLRRRIVGWPFIALTRATMGEPTHDVYCGFKLWRASAAEAVFSRQRLDGWVFDAEVLGLARRLGFEIREVGITWADRKGSKLSIFRVLLPAMRELFAARRTVRAQPRLEPRRGKARSSPAGVERQLAPDASEH